MTSQELVELLGKLNMTSKEMSEVLGVSKQAVDNWIEGRRDISLMMSRLFKLFESDPEIMDKFETITDLSSGN